MAAQLLFCEVLLQVFVQNTHTRYISCADSIDFLFSHYPFLSFLVFAGLLDGIHCPHRPDVCNYLLVGDHIHS